MMARIQGLPSVIEDLQGCPNELHISTSWNIRLSNSEASSTAARWPFRNAAGFKVLAGLFGVTVIRSLKQKVSVVFPVGT